MAAVSFNSSCPRLVLDIAQPLDIEEKPETSPTDSSYRKSIENDGDLSRESEKTLQPTGFPSRDATTNQGGAAQKLQGWRLVVVEICLCIGLLFSAMDSSIVSTALVTIGAYFDGFVKIIWIVLAYLLSYMTFAIMWAKLSDLFGRKACVLAAWCIFTAFSLGCGLAQSLDQLIAFRTLQGFGGGGLYSLGNVVMPEITPNKYYSVMTGAQGAIFAISSVLGPVLGGIIAKKTTWRWIFYLNLPFGVIVFLVLFIIWPNSPAGTGDWSNALKKFLRFDYVGAFILAAASVLLVLGLQSGGSEVSAWDSALVIGSLAASISCWASLLLWNVYRELRWARSSIPPLFPLRVVKIRSVSAAFLITVSTGFPLFMAIVSIPERYQVVNTDSSISAGIRLMPLLVSSAVGSTVNGVITHGKNLTFYTLLGANCLLLLGSGLLTTVSNSPTVEPAIYGFEVLFGLGLGGTFSSTAIVAAINSNFEDYALAAGIVNQARIFGGAIGLACSTIILNIRFDSDLAGILSLGEMVSLRQTLNEVSSLTPLQQSAVRQAFANAFQDQFRICTYIAAVCVVISLLNYHRHPVNLKKRLELGEAVAKGRMPADEGDKLLRAVE